MKEENVYFFIQKDLFIIENDTDLILRKGFLHINEIIIDKKNSSREFLKKIRILFKNKNIELTQNDTVYDDFIKLVQLGFINLKSNKKNIILTNSNYIEFIKSIYNENDIGDINLISNFISFDEQKVIREDKSFLLIEDIKEKFYKKIKEFNHIYVIEDFANITTLRSINKICNLLDIEITIGFIDNNNIYLTGIKPNYTGCYECLENHILSKFQGNILTYENKFKNNYLKNSFCKENILILLSLIVKDMKNIEKNSISSLTGNIIHIFTENFEYSFNSNLKSIACSVCAGINKCKFEEQNIKSINIIKEAFND